MKFHISILLGCLLAFPALAEAPLKFKAWKEQQILEAQNEVLRISARLHSLKNNPKPEKPQKKDDSTATSLRFDSVPDLTDRDLKLAQENLAIAKELSLEDYAEVYVSSLQENPSQFSKLMNSLTREEMSQLMKILVKNKAEGTIDTKRNGSAAASLPGSHS